MLPRSTPETFSEKLYQTFRDHKRFIKPKLTRSDFTLIHYAGDVSFTSHLLFLELKVDIHTIFEVSFPCYSFQVRYQSDQFLDKNKDYVVAEHQDLLNASKCSFVAGLFPPLSKESSKSKFSSIGARFKVPAKPLSLFFN